MQHLFSVFTGLTTLPMVSACQHATAPAAPNVPARPPAAAAPPPPPAGYASVPAATSPETSYVFGWGDRPASIARPRGGSTRGATVTLAPGQRFDPADAERDIRATLTSFLADPGPP